MVTSAKMVKKVTSTLKLPRSVTELVSTADHVVAPTTNKPHFPSPAPTLPRSQAIPAEKSFELTNTSP
jgi:hypothetical protein